MGKNIDAETVESFGDEWARFDQRQLDEGEIRKIYADYFSIFPWESVPESAIGFDMGCGSGRWARLVAPRIGTLHCIDPSAAIEVARSNLKDLGNVVFHQASVDDRVLPDASCDFGYSLGVLHHIPDTQQALASCVKMLKPGAPFLLYLYYAFDNRPWWFRGIWKASELLRALVRKLPPGLKHAVTSILAGVVYFPLARIALLLERLGANVEVMPLSYYRNHSFYTMRTDARDRFGTPLEQRFTQQQVRAMMEQAGLTGIRFGESAPYWCAVGMKL